MEHAVIKYFPFNGFTGFQITEEIDNTVDDSLPPYSIVERWVSEFKNGRTSINDEPCFGRPVEVTNILQIVIKDHRLKLSEVAKTKISQEHFAHKETLRKMGCALINI